MKVIVIGGYPGSGKSTIVRGVLDKLSEEGKKIIVMKYGKLVTYMECGNLLILGTYSKDEKFPGTDRYAMNAQPEAQAFLLELRDTAPEDRVVLFEGDRLFNDKMLKFLKAEGFNLVLCLVQVNHALIEARRDERSAQSATWRKGRETKVDRISFAYPVTHYLMNNTETQQQASIAELIAEINGTWFATQPPESKLKQLWK